MFRKLIVGVPLLLVFVIFSVWSLPIPMSTHLNNRFERLSDLVSNVTGKELKVPHEFYDGDRFLISEVYANLDVIINALWEYEREKERKRKEAKDLVTDETRP